MTVGLYKAVFIIPSPSNKVLGADGWLFESSERLTSDIVDGVRDSLDLVLTEEYCGAQVYEGRGVKASVLYDDNRQVEQIYLQIYGGECSQIIELIKKRIGYLCVEVFVPHLHQQQLPEQGEPGELRP